MQIVQHRKDNLKSQIFVKYHSNDNLKNIIVFSAVGYY